MTQDSMFIKISKSSEATNPCSKAIGIYRQEYDTDSKRSEVSQILSLAAVTYRTRKLAATVCLLSETGQ